MTCGSTWPNQAYMGSDWPVFFMGPKNFTHTDNKVNKFRSNFVKPNASWFKPSVWPQNHDSPSFFDHWTILILKTLNYTHVVIPKIKMNYMMHHQKYYAHVRCNRSLPVKCWVRSCFRQIDTELRILNQVYEYVSGVAKSKIFSVIENETKKMVSNRFLKSRIIFYS